jgi:hypothetical protein
MSPFELLGLHANRHMVSAIRELQKRQELAELDSEYLFDLVHLATGDREQAEKAARELIKSKMRKGETPT